MFNFVVLPIDDFVPIAHLCYRGRSGTVLGLSLGVTFVARLHRASNLRFMATQSELPGQRLEVR